MSAALVNFWKPRRGSTRLAASYQVRLLLFLLGIWAFSAPPAAAQDETLTGWFTLTVIDYPPASGRAAETTYTLTEDTGARHELLIDTQLMQPLGGPVALNRKRVTVVGEWEAGGPAAPEQFHVRAIALAASPSITFPGTADRPLAFEALSEETTTSKLARQSAEPASHMRGSQAWVTILCRFADAPDVTPHPVSHYEKLMGASYPGLDHYWREVSYGRIDLTGSVVVGWYTLPQPRSYYGSDEDGDGKVDATKTELEEDCSAAADADVFFPDFDGINFIFSPWFDCAVMLDCAPIYGGTTYLVKDGHQQPYGFTVTALEPGRPGIHAALAHEMSHAFGLPHSSGPYDATYDSYWDAVSIGSCSFPGPAYGCIDVHPIAYHKDLLGWIPPARKYVAPPNSTRTITLERLAQPHATGYLLAQIPIGDSTTDFYTVEARLFAGYDDAIPGEAVIIHKVDTTRGDRLAQVVDVDNNGDPNDEGAMWTPGEIFTDLANGVQVSVEAKHPTGYRVTITTHLAALTSCIDLLLPTTPRHIFFRPGRDTGSVPVKAASTCHWSGTSNTEWIRVTSGGSGRGNGAVSYALAANPHRTARTGTLTIGGWTFTVTQAGVGDPLHMLFADNMEDGESGWLHSRLWARTTTTARSGIHAWAGRSGAHYHESHLQSLTIDLSGVSAATLIFWHRYDFARGEAGWLYVTNARGPDSFTGDAYAFTGTASTWSQVVIDLTHYIGQAIDVSFSLTGARGTAAGWYIDDVAVFSSTPPPVPDPHRCRDYGPCGAGQGDCDPGQCQVGLVCTPDVGGRYGLPAHYDVCEVPSGGTPPDPDPDYCRDFGPCGVGQGDCDPGQCQVGLVCTPDVGWRYGLPRRQEVGDAVPLLRGDGWRYGLPPHYDVCEVSSERPDPDYCRDFGPCSAGQGDCDPGQCEPGLVCAADVGAQYGLPAYYDVCEVVSGG